MNKISNKDYIFCFITSTVDLDKTVNTYDKYILEIIKKYSKFTIINFCNYYNNNKLVKKNNQKLKKNYKDKIDFFYPKNKKEFLTYINNKKVFAIDGLGKSFKEFRVRYLLKRPNIFLILLVIYGGFSNEEKNFTHTSIKNKKLLFIKIINKFIYRFFVFLNIFPKTYFYFESRKIIFENYKNGKIRKISKNFPIFKFLLNFLNIYNINSNAYSNFTNHPKKNKIKSKNIIFIDGNYNHQDMSQREDIDLSSIKKKYFELLKNKFFYLEKIFKKKIEICLHPSSNKSAYKKYFKNFKIHKGKTREKIYESYMVIFHESSAVMDAMLLNKKILIFETDLLGKYHSKRVSFFKDSLKLPSIKIENKTVLTKSQILKKFDQSKKYRNLYIKNNLKSDSSRSPTKKFILIINKFINNEKQLNI